MNTSCAAATFPFAAIVGQQESCLALLLAAVSPSLGGVLLRGEKGTAKSTLARGIVGVLPEGRLVTLPLGATEDGVIGGLDLQATLACGTPVAEPGLLAGVDGGVLYVDEVNLLPDHLVDVLLDAAVSGVVRLEREGLAATFAARFTLIGTMNPEEGALRPQLLDRFGLCVDVAAEAQIDARAEIIDRTLRWGQDPAAFEHAWSDPQAELRRTVAAARRDVASVTVPAVVTRMAADLALDAAVAGHRADVLLTRAARAHAALRGRRVTSQDDVLAVAELVLRHRRRSQVPPDPPLPPAAGSDGQEPDRDGPTPPEEPSDPDEAPGSGPHSGAHDERAPSPPAGDEQQPPETEPQRPQTPEVGEPFRVVPITPALDRLARHGSGRRQRTYQSGRRGRYIRARPAPSGDSRPDLAIDATLRAAAVHQRARRAAHPSPGDAPAILVRRTDWQAKVRVGYAASCVVFVVDASGSMGARGRMVASKGAVLSLLLDAYVHRDRVALVSFRQHDAHVVVAPTTSVEMANRALSELPVGGRTPLAAGLVTAYQVVRPLLVRDPTLRPLMILVTDGHANLTVAGERTAGAVHEALGIAEALGADPRITWIVVDTQSQRQFRLEYAQKFAMALNAPCYAIDDLRADDLVGLAKGHRP